MKFNAGTFGDIEINMDIVISALRAIEKAVSEDVPNELRKTNFETNNRIEDFAAIGSTKISASSL